MRQTSDRQTRPEQSRQTDKRTNGLTNSQKDTQTAVDVEVEE